MARKLVVEVVLDAAAYSRQVKQATAQTTKFSKDLENIGRGSLAATIGFRGLGRAVGFASGGFLTGAGLVAGMKASVNAASDLHEQMSKNTVVFGKSSQEVVDWSKTSAQAMGLSQRAALGVASSFGALFKPLGVAGRTAEEQSTKLTQLGADLASFYNTNVQDALDAIRSGLVGESEPLRRYGVLLSESRVQQEALTETGKTATSQLTDQEKVFARITLIMRDSKQAQGDYARTAGGLANQTRTLSANLDDLASTIGGKLLPALSDIAGAANKQIANTQKSGTTASNVSKTFHLFAKTLEVVAENSGKVGRRLPGVAPLIGGVDAAASAATTSLKGLAALNDLVFPAKVTKRANQFKDALFAISLLTTDIAKPKYRDLTKGGIQIPADVTPADIDKLFRGPYRASADEKAARRNQWFDARIARQLGRVQDLGLRAQLPRLKFIAQELRDRLAVTRDATRRLTLEDQLLEVARQQKAVQGQITGQMLEQNQALKDRADAIKSAALSLLGRRQEAAQNRDALQDAIAQLGLARRIGGPGGIREAARNLRDVRFQVARSQLESTPFTLRGGSLAVGNQITINVHGVTDPNQVANQVVAVIERRTRHTVRQQRGPTAGAAGPR